MLAQLLPDIHFLLHLGHLYSPKHLFFPWYGVNPSPLGRAFKTQDKKDKRYVYNYISLTSEWLFLSSGKAQFQLVELSTIQISHKKRVKYQPVDSLWCSVLSGSTGGRDRCWVVSCLVFYLPPRTEHWTDLSGHFHLGLSLRMVMWQMSYDCSEVNWLGDLLPVMKVFIGHSKTNTQTQKISFGCYNIIHVCLANIGLSMMFT